MTRSVFSPAYAALRDGLVSARLTKGITQVELAELLGRPQSFVSKIERGERRLDLVELVEITEALGVRAEDLVAAVRIALATSDEQRA
jgi:transcriptional regulator with XRE-family HTH domain